MSSQVIINSTGQTIADIEGLAGLLNLASSRGALPLSFTPPALLNPHYIPPSRGQNFIIVQSILIAFSILFVVLRIWARLSSRLEKLFLDDYVLVVALITVIGTTSINLLCVYAWNFGRHAYDLHIGGIVNIFKAGYAYHITALWAASFVRISIGLFIRRLYRDLHPKMARACTIYIIINVLFSFATTLAFIFQCPNRKAAYDIYESIKSNCLQKDIWISQAAIQILFDLIALVLPIRMVLGLNITANKRFEVCAMLALGLLPTAAAIARVFFLFHAIDNRRETDFTWELIPFGYCCQIEVNLAIMTACIPAIKGLFTSSSKKSSFEQLTRRRNSKKNNHLDLFSNPDNDMETGAVQPSRLAKIPNPIFTTPNYSNMEKSYAKTSDNNSSFDSEIEHALQTPRRRITFGELRTTWTAAEDGYKSPLPYSPSVDLPSPARRTQHHDNMTFITQAE